MGIEELPRGLGRRALTEPAAARDVLELCVNPASREEGALFVLLCDAQDRLLQPVAVDGLPAECGDADRERVLSTFADLLASGEALLVAIARPGDPAPTRDDLRWLLSAQAVCHRAAVRLIGVHVVTPLGQHALFA